VNKEPQKIAIVGCGWLGESLADFFLENGNLIFGTTRTSSKAEQLKQKGITAHLLTGFEDDLSWLTTMDVLILNIPPSSFGAQYPAFMLHIAQQKGPETKVIFISSTSVYDNCNAQVNETETLVGNSPRGSVVYQAEQVLSKEFGGDLTIIRMAGLVGKERHPVKFMSGKEYPGNEEPINLIHLTDCIGLIDAVIKTACWGEVLNGCSGEHPQKGEYYTWAAKELNLPEPKFTDEKTTFKIISNDKSKVTLGYAYVYDSPFEFPL
jgi:nucleoside-diphosphate-sugar epimerase